MTQKQRMENGLLYLPMGEEIMTEQLERLEKLYEFNAARPKELGRKRELLMEMFAEIGEDCYIEPPLHANWAGKRVKFGKGVYANFNLTLVDDAEITVGDYTMFAPNVTVATAAHPVLPELRAKTYQYNRPVKIGANVWIGTGAVILPGVTIGDNSVIGAGSVVTRDIPPDVVAAGNPCRVMREIGEKDRKYYFRQEETDWENIE